jgi:hypothetical protein
MRSEPRTAVVTIALGICALVAVPVQAAGPTIVASPNPVVAGTLVRIHGVVAGCAVGDRVTLISKAFVHSHDFAGLPAVFAPVHAGGRYSVSTRIPATRHGSYAISGRCGGGNLGVTRTLHVDRPAMMR